MGCLICASFRRVIVLYLAIRCLTEWGESIYICIEVGLLVSNGKNVGLISLLNIWVFVKCLILSVVVYFSSRIE